jgi:hypothetical protein
VVSDVGATPVAAYPHPIRRDKVYVLDAGDGEQSGGIVELVRTPGRAEVWDVARSLAVSGAPACAGYSRDARYLVVTLRRGGMLALDLDSWDVVREWSADDVAESACVFGGAPGAAELYVTAGGAAGAWLYVLGVDEGEPRIVARHDLQAAGSDPRAAFVHPRGREVWVLHHGSGSASIHPLATLRERDHAYETMTGIGAAPAAAAVAPDGRRAFIADAAAAAPGIAIVDLPTRTLVRTVALGEPGASRIRSVFIPLAE